MAISDLELYVALASLPAILACGVGYRWPASRETSYRSTAILTGRYVALALVGGGYYLGQYVVRPEPVRLEFLGFAAAYGGVLLTVLVAYTFASSAVGLAVGASLAR